MLTYPKLTDAEQTNLPKLLSKPSAITNKYEDSTHQLWHCQTTDGEMVLKVCNHASVAKSHFWLGLNHLFDANFPTNLREIHLTHDFLAQYGTLKVPDLIAASANQFVLTRFFPGVDLDANEVDDKWVVKLAKHISQLHQCTYKNWGDLHAPQFSAQEWSTRLQQTLALLAEKSSITLDKAWLNEILVQAGQLQETEFVPIMLDLRWDQMRQLGENELALIDLDAFVIAPKNLDLVLLEYILSPAQWLLFKAQYCQSHAWPDYTQQKPCYQLLLFFMNILGETNLTRWMGQI